MKEKLKISKVKNMSDNEMEILGKIMLTEFVGELGKPELEYLKKLNPNITDQFRGQLEFKKTRDDLINSTFTNDGKKNEKLKECLFGNIKIYEAPTNENKEQGKPWLHEQSFKKVEEFKKLRVDTKEGMIAMLNGIHKTSQDEIRLYIQICQNAFVESLSSSEMKFANVKNQEEYQRYLRWNEFKAGYSECCPTYVWDMIYPPEHKSSMTIRFSTPDYQPLFHDLASSRSLKYKIYNEMKEFRIIKNFEEDVIAKRKLDKTVVNNFNFDDLRDEHLGKQNSGVRR